MKSRPELAQLLRHADAQRLFRFGLTGGIVTITYLSTTTVGANVVGLTFQAALALGFALAIALHFTLQRLFVWRHVAGFELPIRSQVMRYLLAAGAQYALTAAVTASVPGWLRVPVIVVYLPTAAIVTLVNFMIFRNSIFHPRMSYTDAET